VDFSKLRDRIAIERPTAERSESGQIVAWEQIAEVSAEIMAIRGTERLRVMAMESTLSHRVRVRYRTDLMPPLDADQWRVRFGTRLFAINAALPDQRRTEIVFECTEGSHDGQ